MRRLHTGLTPPLAGAAHAPFIKIAPRHIPRPDDRFAEIKTASHFIFTSKTAVDLLLNAIPSFTQLSSCPCFAVGQKTKGCLNKWGFDNVAASKTETAEGLIASIEEHNLIHPKFFWPHSALSRRVIPDYCQKKMIPLIDLILYDTLPNIPDPIPDLQDFDEIIFTSPSSVEGFLSVYGSLPQTCQLTPIGPITADALRRNQ